jgi:hypothetical protein
MGEAYVNTMSQQAAVDWQALVASTEGMATLAPSAVLLPLVGFVVGRLVASYADAAGAKVTRTAHAVYGKRS